MARETTTYKGAAVSVPPGTDFYRVPFPAADFPQGTGSAHPHSCPYPYPIALFLLKSKAEEKPCPAVFIPRFSRA